MAAERSPSETRRLTVELPTELVAWLRETAEISHRTPDTMVADLLERQRERWEADCDPGAQPPDHG
jgi:predicted transcriptional regulator